MSLNLDQDAIERPGSSALWVGNNHHLNREEVRELRDALTRWLETGDLRPADEIADQRG